jgi:predicted O-methyltransferase YrrM
VEWPGKKGLGKGEFASLIPRARLADRIQPHYDDPSRMKRRFSHWTPQYIRDRLRWYYYFHKHPDVPWLSEEANALLETLIKPTDVGVEWGSGRSTCWLGRHVKHLVSVEEDRAWAEQVRGQVQKLGLTNVDFRFYEGMHLEDPESSEYVRVAQSFADNSIDFALVDGGWAREQCALAAIPKLKPGGVLIVDDIHYYLDRPTTAPSSRYGLGHASNYWVQFLEIVQSWRMVVGTQGIKDTGFWIKPPAQGS